MPELPTRCPICGGEVRVQRLRCGECDSEVAGSFTLGRLFSLRPEQARFVEVFLKNEGTIKNVEAELGVSYPTVRARLREVIRALGYELREEPPPQQPPTPAPQPTPTSQPPAPPPYLERQREILDALSKHQISADEATRLLQGTRAGRPSAS